MRLRPASWLSWQLSLLLLLALVCGVAAGALLATVVYMQEAAPVAKELARKTSRIELLELMVQQQSPETYAALDHSGQSGNPVAGPQPQSPPAPAVAPSPPSSAPPPIPTPPPAHAAKAPAPKPVPAAPVAAPRAAPKQQHVGATSLEPAAGGATQADSPGAAPALSPVEAVTGEELMLAMKARIEGVPAEKAGVKSVEKGAVLLRNGSVVRVGQAFPSGEKLLQVDAENNRVVTSKRQMLLFFSN